MLKDVGLMVITDFFLTIILLSFLFGKQEKTYACSQDLFWVGVGFDVYFAWFTVRNLAIMAACWFSQKPDDLALLGRISCACVDWIVFTAFILWASYVMFSESTKECIEESPEIKSWWFACAICLLFGWTYGLVVFCSCSIFCPIFSCIVCFFLSAGQ